MGIKNTNKYLKNCFEYFMIIIGAVIAAFAVEEFLVPCMILDGGVVGISFIVSSLTNIPLGLLTFVLNIPFLLIGMKKLGGTIVARTTAAMTAFSLSVSLFEHFGSVTQEYLLSVSFGGVILGFGVGLVIRFNGCLDGTETVAMLLNRKYNLPVGQMVLGINVVIYSVAGIIFGIDIAMYSLLTYFIASKLLDFVESGVEQAKAAMIITDKGREIADAIYINMGRTVTILEGEGLISGKKVVLYCVLTRLEIYQLKHIINNVDGSAFTAISDVSEIIGNHIKKKGESQQNANVFKT